jgi:hypothetical protein
MSCFEGFENSEGFFTMTWGGGLMISENFSGLFEVKFQLSLDCSTCSVSLHSKIGLLLHHISCLILLRAASAFF